jgi:soluble lytic murein transglycosylase
VFYLGRLALKDGDTAAALAWFRFLTRRYPNYYYTYIARPELRRLETQKLTPAAAVERFLAGLSFPARPIEANFTPDAACARHIERARLLASARLDNWAEEELRFAARHGVSPWPIALELATMATNQGAPDRALRHIKGVVPNYLFLPRAAAPDRFWRLAFPLPYRAALVKYARGAGLDAYVVAALIRQESEFNAKAVSPSNAIGLMQIMPSVGRDLARKQHMRGFRPSLLTRPEVNLRLGAFYFRRLIDAYDGKLEQALAAYNAGPSRVALWRGWSPASESFEFVETIPFRQTRDYVQIIERNAELYREIYDGTPADGSQTAKPAAQQGPTQARRAEPATAPAEQGRRSRATRGKRRSDRP